MKDFLKYEELGDNQKTLLNKVFRGTEEGCEGRLYDAIVDCINTIDNKDSIEVIKMLPRIKPIYNLKTIVFLLEEYCQNTSKTEIILKEMEEYHDIEIDMFMLMNILF